MMWGYIGPWTWGGSLMMMISMLIWVAVIGLLLFFLARWLGLTNGQGALPRATPSPQEIIEQRYARGEIDEATFQRMRDQLTPR